MEAPARQPRPAAEPDEPYPSAAALDRATAHHRQGEFVVSARKLPISKSGPIDAMAGRLGIPVPEMIFGENLVRVAHAPSGWAVSFTAEAALDRVDKTDRNMLRVAHAGAWSSSRERTSAGIKEVVRPYDWSYSTDYRGTETPGSLPAPPPASAPGGEGRAGGAEKDEGEGEQRRRRARALAPDPAAQIPLELLKRRDPILFYDEVMLYESELDDNGISLLSVKLRVMERRMLLLCRLYMRLDDVVVRVRDTRVYVDFDRRHVVREYQAKEDSFANVKRSLLMSGLLPDAVIVAMRDANQVAPLLPVVETEVESVTLA